MINVSNAFKQVMYSTEYVYTVTIKYEDGTTTTIGNADLVASGNSIAAQFGTSSMPLGVAMSKELTLKLTNEDGRWDDKEFQFAEVKVQVSLNVGSGVETVKLGTYYVAEPAEYGSVVELKAYDEMYKAGEVQFDPGVLPAPMVTVLGRACTQAGLLLDTGTIFNSNFEIKAIPDDLTCRQVIGFCAMIAGGNAFISALDEDVVIKRYTAPTTDAHIFTEYKDVTVGTDDITITGISCAQGEERILAGTEGYVLAIENDLIDVDAQAGVTAIANALVGFTFRNMQVSSFRYPLIEPMDSCKVTDLKNRTANTVVTGYTFDFTGFTEVECSADSPIRNSAAGSYQNPTVKAIQAAREEVKKERTERELAIENLQKELDGIDGMHTSTETQPDGSVITYMHDKPTVAESKLVLKISSVIGVSTDGGKTYPHGIDLYDANAILNNIYAVGIDAEHVKIGGSSVTSTIYSLQNQIDGAIETFSGSTAPTLTNYPANTWQTDDYAAHAGDLFVGTAGSSIQGFWYRFQYNATSRTYEWVQLRDNDIQKAIADASDAVSKAEAAQDTANGSVKTAEVQYYVSTSPTELSGGNWSKNTPAWASGSYIWTRTKFTSANGASVTYSDPSCITGAEGKGGAAGESTYTHIRYSANADGTAFVTSPSATTLYIGIYTGTSKTAPSGKSSYTWSRYVGQDGEDGEDGKDGNGINSITYYYLTNNSSSKPSASSVTSTTMTMPTASNRYLWQKEVIDFTDSAVSDKTTVVLLAVYGETGQPGTSVSISSTSITYQASSSGTTVPTGTWSTNVPTVANGKYLWTRTVVNYSPSGSTTSYSVAYKGTNGDKGDTGTGVGSITAEFYLSTSKDEPTGGSWVEDPPTWENGKYMWTRSKIVYVDPPSTEYTTPVCDSSWEAVNEVTDGLAAGTTIIDGGCIQTGVITDMSGNYSLDMTTGTVNMKNANITGGTINIVANSSDANIIALLANNGNVNSLISPSSFDLHNYRVTDDYYMYMNEFLSASELRFTNNNNAYGLENYRGDIEINTSGITFNDSDGNLKGSYPSTGIADLSSVNQVDMLNSASDTVQMFKVGNFTICIGHRHVATNSSGAKSFSYNHPRAFTKIFAYFDSCEANFYQDGTTSQADARVIFSQCDKTKIFGHVYASAQTSYINYKYIIFGTE